MVKIMYRLAALACLFVVATAMFDPSPSIIPPDLNRFCYKYQLNKDMNVDLSFVSNNGMQYPELEIEEALYYAEDQWRIYLNLTSTCFQEKKNFFMNRHTEKDFYYLKSVCKTTRRMVHSVYADVEQTRVCHVVRPEAQKVYFAECGGTCNLGYDGVTGYHCIPKGLTHRKFLVYCKYDNYPTTSPLNCIDPYNGEYDPRSLNATYRMTHELLPDGSMYKPTGYFTEFSVAMPTYCGCRGYFCNH